MGQWTIERTIFFYTMVIATGVYLILAVNFLSFQGFITSKNEELTHDNSKVLHHMNEALMSNATLNISKENHQTLENIYLILKNMSRLH
jgi:hypothetical protein